jgi:hypothetical protein
MGYADATFIGKVDSVKGGVVTIRIKDGLPTLIMVNGQSYRVGQIGSFLRIPLGYAQLYGVCTLVGAAAAPHAEVVNQEYSQRWMSITLFGESVGDFFERGVSQYPTFGDEVHLVTIDDMKIIYNVFDKERTITIGNIAATSGIPGSLDLSRLVTRHSTIVGSTGAGKSNLVAVLLEAIASQGYNSSRILVIDPHGEYASAVGLKGYVYKINPDRTREERSLYVPFWALPFEELKQIAFGELQPSSEAGIRDEITERKIMASKHLDTPTPEMAITADSPIPFNIKRLWFDLDDYERLTFKKNNGEEPYEPMSPGDPDKLIPNSYPRPAIGPIAPFKNPRPRNISKQLDLLRSRLLDSRFSFLFIPGDDLSPDGEGKIKGDLDSLVRSWVGHDRTVTVLDVSGLPSEVLITVVGTLLRIVYDILFWGTSLPVGGRAQPLLIILEEAHLFLPEGKNTPAHRTIGQIAKEGRKYGVGLCIITQRPTEIDSTTLSQCGTMIALRLTNSADRAKVESTMPDDLGALSGLLPSLRTGEGLVIGEAMPIPSRIQFYRAANKPYGDDPDVAIAWSQERPEGESYKDALNNWRRQSNIPEKEGENG